MSFHWRLHPHDPDRIQALSRGASLPPIVAQLLLNRGVSEPQAARRFLEAKRLDFHDPELLPGAVEAADRIARAAFAGRRIVIYGDYDVDGVCGTSLLWACLKLAGAKNVSYYIPHRIEEGYGVNADALRKLATEQGAELIVTVDCGITAVAEARLARELGVEFIITDHHVPGPALPEADVVVHPRRPGGSYPFGDLCGCGVAFKLAWQLCKGFGDGKKASPHLRDFLVKAIHLVALATVADVVPLADENRIFVRHGLNGLTTEPSVGMRALLEVSECLGKDRLTASQLGFQLGPRVNAAGRMEAARMAVELFTTDDPDRAKEIAAALDQCNRDRQDIERATVEAAKAQLEAQGGLGDRGGIVLGAEGWHHGVIGIVAGRIAEWYHRPTVIITLNGGLGQGSARSVPGFNLHEALSACSQHLTSFGGHAAAAGLKVSASEFEAFSQCFDEHCRATLTPDQKRKDLWIDAEARLGELTLPVVETIGRLEPHGMGNPKPALLATELHVVGPPRIVGKKLNHLKLRLGQGSLTLGAIGWNLAGRAAEFPPGTPCSAVFAPGINEWNNRREVQLEIRDIRPAGAEPSGGPTSRG